MKVSVVMGTRPEVIKLSPVIFELKKRGHDVQVVCVLQQKDLAPEAIKVFGVEVDEYVHILMDDSQRLNSILVQTIKGLDNIFDSFLPDVVIVQGDTSTALAGAMCAFNMGIPVAHVEAGLRSGNPLSPYPEEMNRILIDEMSTHHYCPTSFSADNLPTHKPIIVGNTELDAILWAMVNGRRCTSHHRNQIMITMHRRENMGDGFKNINNAILRLSKEHPDKEFLIMGHPNHRPAQDVFNKQDNVLLCAPEAFDYFIDLLRNASLIITDSGGLQEDGAFLHIPVVITRKETERMEGVISGSAILAGIEEDNIVDAANKALKKDPIQSLLTECPYGDGHSSELIADDLEEHYVKRIAGGNTNEWFTNGDGETNI